MVVSYSTYIPIIQSKKPNQDPSVRSRTIRNTPQARVSVPSYLKPLSSQESSSPSPSTVTSTSTSTSTPPTPTGLAPETPDTIATLHPSLLASSSTSSSQQQQSQQKYTWTTDLASTSPYWNGWFEGLSSKFLSARGGKLLILAGTDRLDKELMVGQMQGTPFPFLSFPTPYTIPFHLPPLPPGVPTSSILSLSLRPGPRRLR